MSMIAERTAVTLDTETVDTIAIMEAEAEVARVHDISRATITWTEADKGLWVANYAGYYGGTVDKQGAHYFVSDTFGQYIGDFGSLEAAEDQLSERLHVMLPGVIRSL